MLNREESAELLFLAIFLLFIGSQYKLEYKTFSPNCVPDYRPHYACMGWEKLP